MPIKVRIGRYDNPVSFQEYRKYLNRSTTRVDLSYTEDAVRQRKSDENLRKEPKLWEVVSDRHKKANRAAYKRDKEKYSNCLKIVTCPWCKQKIQVKAWRCTACSRCKKKFHIRADERVAKCDELTAPNVVR